MRIIQCWIIATVLAILTACVSDPLQSSCEDAGKKEALKMLAEEGILLCATINLREGWSGGEVDTTIATCEDGQFPNVVLSKTAELNQRIFFKQSAKK